MKLCHQGLFFFNYYFFSVSVCVCVALAFSKCESVGWIHLVHGLEMGLERTSWVIRSSPLLLQATVSYNPFNKLIKLNHLLVSGLFSWKFCNSCCFQLMQVIYEI